MKFSINQENYIKAIFHLQQQAATVSTNALAGALNTKPASVTDMLKKLKTQKLLQYEKYKGVYLTAEGRKVAIQIIRKHRLWEYFLVKKLRFGWEEVHEIADELEHISSKKLIDRIDEFLGYPKYDPHGDPIPDRAGKMTSGNQLQILHLTPGIKAVVCAIGDQSEKMLELLNHKKICLGTPIVVKQRFEVDGSMEIKLENEVLLTISEQVAKQVFVQYDNQ
jgi:DtxR family Mn-dependent transcriptional regulator